MVEKKTSIEIWESVKLPILSLFRSWHVDIPSLPPCSKRMLLCVGIYLAPMCSAISDVIIIVAWISNDTWTPNLPRNVGGPGVGLFPGTCTEAQHTEWIHEAQPNTHMEFILPAKYQAVGLFYFRPSTCHRRGPVLAKDSAAVQCSVHEGNALTLWCSPGGYPATPPYPATPLYV